MPKTVTTNDNDDDDDDSNECHQMMTMTEMPDDNE